MKSWILIVVLMISGCGGTYYRSQPKIEYRVEKSISDTHLYKNLETQPIATTTPSSFVEKVPPVVLMKKKSKRLEDQLKRIHKLTE